MSTRSSVMVVLNWDGLGLHCTYSVDVLPDVRLEMSAGFANIARRATWTYIFSHMYANKPFSNGNSIARTSNYLPEKKKNKEMMEQSPHLFR